MKSKEKSAWLPVRAAVSAPRPRAASAPAARRLRCITAAAREEAEAVAADIEKCGGNALLVHGDVAEAGTMDRLIAETVAGFGRLDILINNAGDQVSRVNIADTTDELFDMHIALNIRPTFAGCRAAVRQLRKQGGGGNIINVSSIAARTGGGGGSYLYAGAKGFISTFSKALAKEVATEGHSRERRFAGCDRDRLAESRDFACAVGGHRIADPDEARRTCRMNAPARFSTCARTSCAVM